MCRRSTSSNRPATTFQVPARAIRRSRFSRSCPMSVSTLCVWVLATGRRMGATQPFAATPDPLQDQAAHGESSPCSSRPRRRPTGSSSCTRPFTCPRRPRWIPTEITLMKPIWQFVLGDDFPPDDQDRSRARSVSQRDAADRLPAVPRRRRGRRRLHDRPHGLGRPQTSDVADEDAHGQRRCPALRPARPILQHRREPARPPDPGEAKTLDGDRDPRRRRTAPDARRGHAHGAELQMAGAAQRRRVDGDRGLRRRQASLTLPARTYYTPGDVVDVDVTISDGVAMHLQPACDPRCPAGCPQSARWTMEYR